MKIKEVSVRTWAEINLDNLRYNVQKIRELSGGKEVMGVIKADAYGMGSVEYARELVESGVKILGVACYEEASELKKCGIDVDVLVFGCTPLESMERAIEKNIHLTISSAKEIDFLERNNLKPKIHIKVDTGMGRVGFTPSEAMEAIKYIRKNEIGQILGVYSHLSVADDVEEDEYTLGQIEKFKPFEELEGIRYKHILNSCGAIRFGDKTNSNLVRPGILLHGIVPFDSNLQNEFKYVFKLKSKVLYLKTIKEGAFISYGKSYYAEKGEVIATIPVGYADGFSRKFSNCSTVIIKGVECPVVGRICMDMTMVRIPEEIQEEVKIGSGVTLIGEDIMEKSEVAGTIPYELMTNLGRRVSRFYIKNGKVDKVKTLEEVERVN